MNLLQEQQEHLTHPTNCWLELYSWQVTPSPHRSARNRLTLLLLQKSAYILMLSLLPELSQQD